MTFKTVDLSAVLNFLWVPLDFLSKNSYYLSREYYSLSFGFGLRQARRLLRSQNIFSVTKEEFKIKTLARKALCPMALQTDRRCGAIDSIPFRVSAKITELAGIEAYDLQP